MNFRLLLSQRVIKFFELSRSEIPKDESPPEHWCCTWRIEIVGSTPNLNYTYFMATNEETCYTLLLQYAGGGFSKLLEHWQARLFETVREMGGFIPGITSGRTLLIRGNPRSLIGSMNDLLFHLDTILENDPARPLMTCEAKLNHVPFRNLADSYPDHAFARLLKTTPLFS